MHQGHTAAGKIKHWLSKKKKKKPKNKKSGSLKQSIAVVDPVNAKKSMETESRAKQSIAIKNPMLAPYFFWVTSSFHPQTSSVLER